MDEELIWFEGGMETFEEAAEVDWRDACEHFENGECLQMGAPCPVRGNLQSFACLLADEGFGEDPEWLEAS